MIPVLVTPYAFRGSVIDIEKAVRRFKDLGYRSVLIADPNFHAHVLFNETMRKNGMIPIHSLVVGKKILIAKNKIGFKSLVFFRNTGTKKLKDVIVKDFSSFRPVMYLDKSERRGYEVMRKILGLKPLDGDFSLEFKETDPSVIGRFEVYDLKEKQVFPSPPKNWVNIGDYPEDWKSRIQREIALVKKKGFEGYFRAVQMIVEAAKGHGIWVGPGRGSAVGSLLAHVLGITSVNPLEYNLIFERFINEGRNEMPDVDIDVEDEKRRELIKILQKNFKFVSLISTYATLKENSLVKALRDIGENSRKVFQMLYGLPVKRSIHAAGVVLSVEDMILPYYMDGNLKVCEYDMESLRSIGVEKIDILGLKTLSFLRKVSERAGISLETIPMNDSSVYEMISSGTTSAVFQLESPEARKISKYVSPKNILELSHVLALNRPGPLKAKLHMEYLRRRLEKRWDTLKDLEDILEETQGLAIYQEQIMLMAVRLANMSLSEADELRKAMAKKDRRKMGEVLTKLESGMKKNGYDTKIVKEMVNFIKEFASYAFNKSHSVAYAHLSYYLSYYKRNFFPQFFLSFIEHSTFEREKIDILVKEAQFFGYRVLNPSVLEPDGNWGENWIILPLIVIRGVGREIPEKIKSEKLKKVSEIAQVVGQAATENLIKAGAFDEIYNSRREALRSLKTGEPPDVLEKLKMRFGEKKKELNPEGIRDKILLEREAMGFALSTPEFKSKRAKIAEAYSLWEARAAHVISLGDGILSDGVSVTFARGLPSGELVVIVDPARGVVNWTKQLDVKIECNIRYLDVRIGCWEEFKRSE